MKKIIAFILCAVMVLSVIPAVTLTASAAGEGDWITKRSPGESDEELAEKGNDKYEPAPGYYYDSEGFHTVSPSYKDITPMFYVRTREAYNMKEGIHVEFRVDEFQYKGTDPETGESLGKDEWLCFSLWPTDTMEPGNTEYGSGWLCLIRGAGDGSATIESCWTTGRNEDGSGGGFNVNGSTNVSVPMDSEGKEYYTLDVIWDGTAYDIQLNGVTVGAMSTMDANLQATNPDGNAYISIIGQTGVSNENVSITITDFNGSVPSGSDKADPDENVNSFADMTPSDSIAAGEPCFRWDANCTCIKKLPETGSNVNIAAKGDGSVHLTATASQIYFGAGPSTSYTYEASDFPVMAMLLRNYNGDDGQFWYAAGDIMQAQNDAVVNWSLWDDYSKEYEVGDDLYNLVVLDMRDYDEERWVGRIHTQRLVFNNLLPEDEEFGEFDMIYFACFRTPEEAVAYADAEIVKINGGEELDTEAPTEEATEAPTEEATEAPTAAEDATVAADETAADGETLADGETVAADATEASDEAESGCASVIGGSVALLLTAMAAAVALKKKN